jgi:hypothetical protein
MYICNVLRIKYTPVYRYIRCFYLADLSTIGIDAIPEPVTRAEVIFQAVYHLEGVFLFAFLLGQVIWLL